MNDKKKNVQPGSGSEIGGSGGSTSGGSISSGDSLTLMFDSLVDGVSLGKSTTSVRMSGKMS